ncbi:putative DNA binding domain-containing protein [Massilia sp. UMI-21]|nr:putative DNA binding domain-containing protein [Massilia sp. UMI-21]
MTYPVYKIDDEQVQHIISLEESYLNDVKAIEIKPSKLSETVSAFANFIGGDIYIGIDEDKSKKTRSWRGFGNPEDANAVVHVLLQSHALGNHLSFEFLSNDSSAGYVLHITVRKVKEIVKASSGEIFIRANAGKIKVDTQEKLRQLEFDKGVATFENEWIECSLNRVENSESIINFMLNVIPTGEPHKYLKNQDLVKDGFVKVSGILLFCDEPAVFLPKRSSIKLMRYKTKNDDISRESLAGDPQTVEGCLYSQIYDAVDKTKKMIEEEKRIGAEGLEAVRYPDETLHEVITNAVLHRDYSRTADIQIRVFDNRIEIESPGRLPGHVTVKNILDTQSARNPQIVRLINKFPNPPNKDVGEGLNTAFEAMRNLKLKPPEIEETENSVIVRIRHEPLASAEQLVLDYMKTHDEINNAKGREITGIKDSNQMKDVFNRLKEMGQLERVPEKLSTASAWRTPK